MILYNGREGGRARSKRSRAGNTQNPFKSSGLGPQLYACCKCTPEAPVPNSPEVGCWVPWTCLAAVSPSPGWQFAPQVSLQFYFSHTYVNVSKIAPPTLACDAMNPATVMSKGLWMGKRNNWASFSMEIQETNTQKEHP